MTKANKDEYIEYLENRLVRFSKMETISNQDLDSLIDTQNEIMANNLCGLKEILNTNDVLTGQLESLKQKAIISDEYVQYLINSFWWKSSRPFRIISRHIRNHRVYTPFDYSNMREIDDTVEVILYVHNYDNDLQERFKEILCQKGLKKITLTVIDFSGSKDVAKVTKANGANYISSFLVDKDILSSNEFLSSDVKYVVYINQWTNIDDDSCLQKMIYPLIKGYTKLSALYDINTSKIEHIKKETFFNELRTRIIKIGKYECLLLPLDRTGVQFIVPTILNEACAIAKCR